ncbi:PIN domain-containing protein [Candidatus Parabeggiatoa sp. HSG14]|uniref:PIN domain-containing protein n=1 Tax=Candidatus Parabeggiatoa sp. HSG14 TaxID=3055593 RepID=UPI0025A73ABF|nr:PIN domain-containing protein [Thiotrichales bacterium HSG14]
MIRLFFDANVLFTAAHNPKGKAALILQLVKHGLWEGITSDYIAQETRRNIMAKYPDRLAALEMLLSDLKCVSSTITYVCPIDLPSKDKPVMQDALAVQASHLLTGDIKHFGRYRNNPKQTMGIIIQTISDFLIAQHLDE